MVEFHYDFPVENDVPATRATATFCKASSFAAADCLMEAADAVVT